MTFSAAGYSTGRTGRITALTLALPSALTWVGEGAVPRFALHCSHEQIPPSRLLRLVQRAEEAGFDAGMSSDHFAPWSERQGESGFAWSFLGAALATTSLPFGVVNAPGQRYHPAIIAQAAASLTRDVPGAAVDRARDRRGVQRAHHRRALAAEGTCARRGCASAWT